MSENYINKKQVKQKSETDWLPQLLPVFKLPKTMISYFHNTFLTLISPPPFLLNCDIINIHEHNLHMIIVFIFLFVSK